MNRRDELKAMIDAVDRIAVEMKKKLRQKAAEGFQGGLDPQARYEVAKRLEDHVTRLTGLCPHCKSLDGDHDHKVNAQQAVDVCNLAMMLWVIGGN